MPEDTVEKVNDFYLRDEISSPLAGIKDFISVKTDSGKRVKLQKRILRFNLKEIYHLFKEDYPDIKIGFTSFSLLRPKHCILAGSSGSHNVCVCSIHQNYKLMLIGKYLKIIYYNTIRERLRKFMRERNIQTTVNSYSYTCIARFFITQNERETRFIARNLRKVCKSMIIACKHSRL